MLKSFNVFGWFEKLKETRSTCRHVVASMPLKRLYYVLFLVFRVYIFVIFVIAVLLYRYNSKKKILI